MREFCCGTDPEFNHAFFEEEYSYWDPQVSGAGCFEDGRVEALDSNKGATPGKVAFRSSSPTNLLTINKSSILRKW